MADLLIISHLHKSFGSLAVTDDVSITVQTGEAIGIIGPNGAGKSTLFNLITGDLLPNSGEVIFDGRKISAMPPYARASAGIGRSYQIPRPFTGMSVMENLMVGAAFAGKGRIKNPLHYCKEILQRTGLFEVADKPAGSLTLLSRKRLELARALATNPRLLLLDEIAGGLTETEAAQLVHLIRDIHASGVTLIWIEHVLHALLPVISRLIVLNTGRLMADGIPHEVINEPLVRQIYLGHEEDVAA